MNHKEDSKMVANKDVETEVPVTKDTVAEVPVANVPMAEVPETGRISYRTVGMGLSTKAIKDQSQRKNLRGPFSEDQSQRTNLSGLISEGKP